MPPEATHHITVRLDELLAERGMTLTQLSQQVGVTQANLAVLKNGRAKAIRFSTLSALCQVLACQPGELLADHRPEPPPDRVPPVTSDRTDT